MRIHPFLMLYRTRFGFAASLSLLAALALLFITSAENLKDYGVLWHHFCGCAPEPLDATLLLNLSTATCLGVGLLMGIGVGVMGGGKTYQSGTAPGLVYGEMRFLLTRPLRRSMVLLIPIAISVATIILFPAAGLLLLLGWLRLVHAPALGHLVDIARLVPGAEGLGQHASLPAVLAATHFARYYAASVTVGLCVFALYYVQRWWMHSTSKWLRLSSILTLLWPATPIFFIHAHRLEAWVFLTSRLGLRPTMADIGAHLAFVAVMLGSCWRIAQRIEV